MPIPTSEEASVYKSPYKHFEVKVLVRMDTEYYDPPIEETFGGAQLDPQLWTSFNPSWGLLEVAGGTIKVGTNSPAISSSWFATVPNRWFPKRPDYDWELIWRMRVNSYAEFGSHVELISLQKQQPILRFDINSTIGFSMQMPGGTEVVNAGTDTTYNTFKIQYDASEKRYEFFIDDEGGSGFISYATLPSENYRADALIFGNSGVRQGGVFNWTEIEVDSVSITGTGELFDLPVWAGAELLYNYLMYENEYWAELPSVLRGHIETNKKNEADVLELELINFMDDLKSVKGGDASDARRQLYTQFSFLNRLIKVQTRINNGTQWTPWRQIFYGICDEKQMELNSEGEAILTLRARDYVRKTLSQTRLIRSYSDFGLAVEGLNMNMDVAQIIQDIAQQGCGLPYSALDVSATPGNRPRTYNIPGRRAVEAIQELMTGMGMLWWPDFSTGQIIIRPTLDALGSDTPQYTFTTDEEVEMVQWNQSSFDFTSQIEVAVVNSEFEDGGFALTYPPIPMPHDGAIDMIDSIVAPSDAQLIGPEIPHNMYMARIRELGSVTITTSCQDWIEHNLEVDLNDDYYLGLSKEDGPWVIDGWNHDWEGTVEFTNRIGLVLQHPDRKVRESLLGQNPPLL